MKLIALCSNSKCKKDPRLHWLNHLYCTDCGSKIEIKDTEDTNASSISTKQLEASKLSSNELPQSGSHVEDSFNSQMDEIIKNLTGSTFPETAPISWDIDNTAIDSTKYGEVLIQTFLDEEKKDIDRLIPESQFEERSSTPAIAIHPEEQMPFPELKGDDINDKVKMQFSYIPKGNYFMGSSSVEPLTEIMEQPKHGVSIKKFWMGTFPVSQSQYFLVTGENPSKFASLTHPVTNVSYYDAIKFCRMYSQLSNKEYRLPTESEWEYACRGRTRSIYHTGSKLNPRLACYKNKECVHEHTSPVGEYPQNQFNLYDMHGNVSEWCLDTWHRTYDEHPKDGSAWISTDLDKDSPRIIRGGSWKDPSYACRSASRNRLDPNIKADNVGFRIVCPGSNPSSTTCS
jgi:formylglycine-generating enzyme required for sulfatase activity